MYSFRVPLVCMQSFRATRFNGFGIVEGRAEHAHAHAHAHTHIFLLLYIGTLVLFIENSQLYANIFLELFINLRMQNLLLLSLPL